jgi:hypothetical protein
MLVNACGGQLSVIEAAFTAHSTGMDALPWQIQSLQNQLYMYYCWLVPASY